LRQLAALSSATFGYALCLQIFGKVDILMLAALHATNAALSQFTAAQSVAMAPGLVASVFGPLLLAHMRRSEGAIAAGVAQRCDQLGAAFGALCIAVAGGAPSISQVLFGEHFRESGELLAWLLVGAGGAVLQSFATAQMVARDRFRTPLVFGGLLIVLAIPAQLVAIPVWHERGAAAVTGIVAMACGLAATAAVPRHRQDRMLLLTKALFCGAVGFGIAHQLGAAGLVLIDAVVGPTAAVALMYALGVLNPSDLRARLSRPRRARVERNSVG
jgi:O-antigen/teichoic acid export membrane protein